MNTQRLVFASCSSYLFSPSRSLFLLGQILGPSIVCAGKVGTLRFLPFYDSGGLRLGPSRL